LATLQSEPWPAARPYRHQTLEGGTAAELTDEVVARFSDAPDPRLSQIMRSLIRHLHAFAVDVRLTQAEWLAGIQFLTATGHKCDDKRQEFIRCPIPSRQDTTPVGSAAPDVRLVAFPSPPA